jgi:hypothetical protein
MFGPQNPQHDIIFTFICAPLSFPVQNETTLCKVGRILSSQGVTFNSDAPTRFLWLTNLPTDYFSPDQETSDLVLNMQIPLFVLL